MPLPPLVGPDDFAAGDAAAVRPGAAALDAPLGDGWLLDPAGRRFHRGLVQPRGARAGAELAQGQAGSHSR